MLAKPGTMWVALGPARSGRTSAAAGRSRRYASGGPPAPCRPATGRGRAVGRGRAGDCDDLGIVEMRQSGVEVSRLDPGIGIQQHAPPGTAPPARTARWPPRGRRLCRRWCRVSMHLGTGLPGDARRCRRWSRRRPHGCSAPGHQRHDRRDAVLDDQRLVVRRDQHRHVAARSSTGRSAAGSAIAAASGVRVSGGRTTGPPPTRPAGPGRRPPQREVHPEDEDGQRPPRHQRDVPFSAADEVGQDLVQRRPGPASSSPYIHR